LLKNSDNSVVKAVTDQLKRKANGSPGKMIFFYNGNGYTADNILKEINDETDFGKLLIEEIIKTATDMFVR